MKYRAIVKIMIEVEFEDDGELALIDQAHYAACDIIDNMDTLSIDVEEVEKVN